MNRFTILLALVGAWALICAGASFANWAHAQESDQSVETRPATTDPEWIVIYNFKRNNEAGEPLLNLRVVIHALTEGDAIVRATFYLNKQMGTVLDMEKVRFVEVGPAQSQRKDEKKTEDKKEEKKEEKK